MNACVSALLLAFPAASQRMGVLSEPREGKRPAQDYTALTCDLSLSLFCFPYLYAKLRRCVGREKPS